MSWISGPCNDEPEVPRNVGPPSDDEGSEPIRWYRVMADSGTHWTSLEPRNPGRFERSRGPVEDAE